jgi:hypothetical protein
VARGKRRPRCSPRTRAHRSHPRETLSPRRIAVRCVSIRDRRHGAGRAWKVRWRRRGTRSDAPAHLDGFRASRLSAHRRRPLLDLHVLDIARSMGYQRVGVWTAQENSPARRSYERAGMILTGKTAPLRSSVALQYECVIEESPHRDVDHVGALWPTVTPAPEDKGLELAGDELRAMRRQRRVEGGPNYRATASTTILSSIWGPYVALLAAVGFAGFLGSALGIWASILWGVGVLSGIVIYGRRRRHQSRSRVALEGQSPSD